MRKYTLAEKLLAITGILLILSLPIGSTFLLTLALTLFIVMVVVNMIQLFGKNMFINIERDSDYLVKESLKNKKICKSRNNIYSITDGRCWYIICSNTTRCNVDTGF